MTATNPTPTATEPQGYTAAREPAPRKTSGAQTSSKRSLDPYSPAPLYVMGGLIAAGALVAFWSGATDLRTAGLRPALMMLALQGAATLVGGFVGFLFGLPRFDYAAREAAAATPAAPATRATAPAAAGAVAATQATAGKTPVRYRPNANLDEIADWLTKIIVGIGLTQLLNIGPNLRNMAAYIVKECGTGCPSQPLVASVIVFATVAGLLFGYLWTRLRYVKLAAATDVDTTETLKQMDADLVKEFGVGGMKRSEAAVGADDVIAEASEDPNKGNFGGHAVANGRALRAIIEPSELGEGLYRIQLAVSSTDARKPLRGTVTFYLHPTFKPDIVKRDVVDGVASLAIVAYGAFTVGARADGGKTELELDLEQHPDATPDFRSR
jgi:prokaryotic YEATS domain